MPIFIISKFDEDPIKNTIAIAGHLAYYIPLDHLVAMQANDLIRLAPNLIHKYPTPVTFLLFILIYYFIFFIFYYLFILFYFFILFLRLFLRIFPLYRADRSSKGENRRTRGKTTRLRKQNLAFPHVTRARLESQR